jgi:predicted DNA-binding antitoxin AbrB/MazE fold protein
MTKILDAVYESGSFRLLTRTILPLDEGQQVRISVEVDTPEDIIALAARVYDGLSDLDIANIERIALDRSSFFTESRS